MALVLRHIKPPPDGEPSAKPDYHLMDGDNLVGRIYQPSFRGGAKWFWSINGLAIRGALVPSGRADTRAEAMAAFKPAWGGETMTAIFPTQLR
jgi:hypothetical protein